MTSFENFPSEINVTTTCVSKTGAKCLESDGFQAKYGTGLVAGYREI